MIRFCDLLLMVTPIMILLTVVDGDCFSIDPQFTTIGSTEVVTCEHDDVKYLVGSKIMTMDCYECDCREKGMTCCGVGIKAGCINVKPGYKVVEYGCDFEIVKDEDKDNCEDMEEYIEN